MKNSILVKPHIAALLLHEWINFKADLVKAGLQSFEGVNIADGRGYFNNQYLQILKP